MARKIQVDLEVNDKGSDKVEKFADKAQGSFSKLQANVVSMNQALELAKKAWQAMEFAFEKAQIGEKLLKQDAAFQRFTTNVGVNSHKMLNDLRQVSGGLVTEAEMIQKAGTAMMMGIDPTKISELMKIAAATSKMTGQTVQEAFADISLAVGRQSKMILDNLGIIISVDAANQKYASTLGKTSDSLTEVERKQAFLNETIRIW